jgi:heptosyltransferase-2
MTHIAKQDPIILVKRSTDGMGDLIMATTGIEALKKKFPSKKVHVAIQKKLHPVLEGNKYIDELLDINDSINLKRYYMIIDISYPCARYEIARLRSGKKVEKNRVEIFAEAIGTRELIRDLRPRFYVSEAEKADGQEFLKDQRADPKKKTIALGTHSAELYRDWPQENYEALIEKIKHKYNLVILHANRTEFYKGTIDACGLPLRKAAGILAACDGLITVDTGLLHMAAALDIPTIALFGPIDYRARCKGYKNTTVIVSDLECIPCWRNATIKCKQTNLVKSYSQCLKNIRPEKVAKLIGMKFNNEG